MNRKCLNEAVEELILANQRIAEAFGLPEVSMKTPKRIVSMVNGNVAKKQRVQLPSCPELEEGGEIGCFNTATEYKKAVQEAIETYVDAYASAVVKAMQAVGGCWFDLPLEDFMKGQLEKLQKSFGEKGYTCKVKGILRQRLEIRIN